MLTITQNDIPIAIISPITTRKKAIFGIMKIMGEILNR
jgi:antitoxin (DNA-binding transcriptional repressor) of toxin-antitoxin stability system